MRSAIRMRGNQTHGETGESLEKPPTSTVLAVTWPLLPRVRVSTSIKPPRSLLLLSSFSQLVPLSDIKSILPAHHGRRCRCYRSRLQRGLHAPCGPQQEVVQQPEVRPWLLPLLGTARAHHASAGSSFLTAGSCFCKSLTGNDCRSQLNMVCVQAHHVFNERFRRQLDEQSTIHGPVEELLQQPAGRHPRFIERYPGEQEHCTQWVSQSGSSSIHKNIGSLAGYPFAPYLSDGIGRRPSIWIGAVCMLAGAALQTACQNINQFIGARYVPVRILTPRSMLIRH